MYETVDFAAIDNYLRTAFAYVTDPGSGPVGFGLSYFIGNSATDCIKLDLYYTDSFIQPPLEVGHIRMATQEEIIAMKIDIVQRGGRKKDFWDLHELMDHYRPVQMIALHELRYPYSHEAALIRSNFIDFTKADNEFDPVCLRGKYWEVVKLEIVREMEKLGG
jgi:Nucleotidyl transferase AbiEii toxin, Type IV TA system